MRNYRCSLDRRQFTATATATTDTERRAALPPIRVLEGQGQGGEGEGGEEEGGEGGGEEEETSGIIIE